MAISIISKERWPHADQRKQVRRNHDRMGIHQLQALLQASKMMNATLDLDQLLSLIVALVTQNLNADRSTLYLVDHERGEIWSRVLEGEQWLQLRLPIGTGLAGRVVQTGEIINLQNAYEDPQFYQAIDARTGYRTRTVLCLPMRNREGTIIGVLQVLNKRDGIFSEQDERFLEAMSSHAAVAIENAVLYNEALTKRRLEHELVIAREIQQRLLPPAIEQTIEPYTIAARNVTCEVVGGDYYEVFRVEDRRIGLALGDVSGKGIPAALLMVATQAGLRSQIRIDPTPQHLIVHLNRLLYESTPASNFVTFFYGLLDQSTGSFAYVNAGHNAPILVNPDGTYQLLDPGGVVLGVLDEAEYQTGSVMLEPGTVLLLFTDGVVEALNEHEEEFGLERFIELVTSKRHLAPTALIQEILETITRFTAAVPQYDDLTMMVIKRA